MRRLSAILLTLTLALALAGTASAAATKSLWGPVILPNGQPAGPIYKSLGVDDLQVALEWDAVAPTQPAAERNPADPEHRWPARIQPAADRAKPRRPGVSRAGCQRPCDVRRTPVRALPVRRAPALAPGGERRPDP